MSNSVQPQRRQPTRLPRPWDSPGKNTGVGCHFLLQCMKVKSQSEVVQLCPTLSDPIDCSLPGSSVHGIFQARVLEWGAIALVSHTSKVMLKILKARLQQYMNCELPDVQARFRKGRGTRYQIANIFWIMEKAREFQKNIYFCSLDYTKAFDCVDHNKLWRILKEMGIPDHLIYLLRNLYGGQEGTIRTLQGTTDWLKIGKGVIVTLFI